MTVCPTHARMGQHVRMELTALPARVHWVTLETTVRQVRIQNVLAKQIRLTDCF